MAKPPKKARSAPAKKKSATLDNVSEYRHEEATRKNNPPAKIAAEGVVPLMPKIKYEYSPRLAPALRFDPTGEPDKLPELLAQAKKRPLKEEELKMLAEACGRRSLGWSGQTSARSGISRLIRSPYISMSASAPRPSSESLPGRTLSRRCSPIHNSSTTRQFSSIATRSPGRIG